MGLSPSSDPCGAGLMSDPRGGLLMGQPHSPATTPSPMLPPALLRRAPRGAAALWGAPRRPTARCPPSAPLDFGGGAALGGRSSWELVRALLVLRLCAVPAVGQHAETVRDNATLPHSAIGQGVRVGGCPIELWGKG